MGRHPPAVVARSLRHAVRLGHDVLAERTVLAPGVGHRRCGIGRGAELCAPRAHPLTLCGQHRAVAARPGETGVAGLSDDHRLVCRTHLHQDRPVAGLRTLRRLRHPRHHSVQSHLPAAVAAHRQTEGRPTGFRFRGPAERLPSRPQEAIAHRTGRDYRGMRGCLFHRRREVRRRHAQPRLSGREY